jgi:hypothetical protein
MLQLLTVSSRKTLQRLALSLQASSPPKRDLAKSIRNGEYFIFHQMQNPILFLLFGLDCLDQSKTLALILMSNHSVAGLPDSESMFSPPQLFTIQVSVRQIVPHSFMRAWREYFQPFNADEIRRTSR